MDFKNYVRMMLEADKAKDQDEERAEDQDDSDEDEDDDEDEDEEQTSVETNNGCTGSEASMKTKNGCVGSKASCNTDEDDDEDEDDDDDKDNEDEKCPDCGKSPCECKKKNLKEAMIYSARYARGEKTSVLTEETRILCEDIKNNSASKYLSKLSKKAEKEAAKFAKRGMTKEAATSKKAASTLKEASNKLYKCETRYKNGDPTAKKEYKSICKQYSKELKNLGKTARGIKGLLFTLISGTVLLGAVGTTVVSNEGLIEKIQRAVEEFKNGNTKRGFSVLGDIAENDKNFINSVITGEKFKGTDFEGKVADWDAQKEGWKDAAEQRKYTEEGPGGFIKKTKQTTKDFFSGAINTYKGAGENFKKILKGAAESARN